jgi:PPOX class probable FMN-dependent enzyme
MKETISTLAELEARYGTVNPNSLRKELPRLSEPYRRLLEAAPFFAVATSGPGGLDCSPRGDPAGSVRVLDDSTIAFADRRGNNRLDTLKNLIADPRVALLFLIPGVSETLRINGRATLSIAPVHLDAFVHNGKVPACVVVVTIDAVYFQCGRALIRSELWNPARHVDRATLPTAGAMTRAADPTFDSASYDAELPSRQRATLY